MNIFMQMPGIEPRLRKLPRVLSVGEIQEGHSLLKKQKGNCGYRSMLSGWRQPCVCSGLFGRVCALVSRDKRFCCLVDLLFQVGILNSAL